MMEAFHPLRIVIGYHGYTTEYGLREGFTKKLEVISKNGPVRGYSPGSFPNLLICGNSTIIKNNGMPMGIPLSDEEFYFHILTTSHGNSMYHLLEMIWTRLSYKFGISSDIFGDDFDIEAIHPFISCKERKIDKENWGWEFLYHPLTRKQLSMPLVSTPWTPTEIDMDKYLILNILIKIGTIIINTDKYFLKFIKTNKLNPEKVIKELCEAKLVYVDEGKMGLLVDELNTVLTPDGNIFAGENRCGEMTSYFSKQILYKPKKE